MAVFFCLASCSALFTDLPDEKERKIIVEGGKSLVIMRLSASLSGKPMTSALRYWDRGFRLEAAAMDPGEIPRLITPVAPSQQAGKEGWVYFILDPGNYYLYVIPPGSFQSTSSDAADVPGRYYRWVKREKIPIPAYWFHIPKGKPIIYLGSLSVSCEKGGLFGQLCQEHSNISIQDESKLARKMAREHFTISITVWTELLLNYGKADVRRIIGESNQLGIYVPGTTVIKHTNFGCPVLPNAGKWKNTVVKKE